MLLPLVLLFIVVPIVEIYVIIQVGQAIGALWTIALLVADSILGSVLMRAQGRAAWRRFNEAIAAGRVPAREVLDGVLVIFGGALLLTPGFVTDVFGFLFVLPFTRPLVRRLLSWYVGRRVSAARRRGGLRFGDLSGMYGPGANEPEPGPGPQVVRGEVIEEDRQGERR
jgi:UPF0716 protein FxsA